MNSQLLRFKRSVMRLVDIVKIFLVTEGMKFHFVRKTEKQWLLKLCFKIVSPFCINIVEYALF